MPFLQLRLFFRIVSNSREVYALKIMTLALAFACAMVMILFGFHEFGYDRFHRDSNSTFRILQRNDAERYDGNRLSDRLPDSLFANLKNRMKHQATFARLKVMGKLSVMTARNTFPDEQIHAADPSISDIFTFQIMEGSLKKFQKQSTVMLSASASTRYFGTTHALGRVLKIFFLRDTISFRVVAVFSDFPKNSHDDFEVVIRFDSTALHTLGFQTNLVSAYGRMLAGNTESLDRALNKIYPRPDAHFILQPLPEIYFGKRVAGENARHGDHYSVRILLCISVLIFILSLSTYINLTSLTLPKRAKEIAIKKVAGCSQLQLFGDFAAESFMVTGISWIIAVSIMLTTSSWLRSILSIRLFDLLKESAISFCLCVLAMIIVSGFSSLIMVLKFTNTHPGKLLSAESLTFPRFKRLIIFFQLGTCLFLLISSLVINRQIQYSLIKEPGRNNDQIVYMRYPHGLTAEGLKNLHHWSDHYANIVDVMASTQLPYNINSRELQSNFYSASVDPCFLDFFGIRVLHGRWFKANDDSAFVVNQRGSLLIKPGDVQPLAVIENLNEPFNRPEKPLKITLTQNFRYNYLCVRILEVDIRKTMTYLSTYFDSAWPATVSYADKQFEDWVRYEDRLHALSSLLSVLSGVMASFAIYGLSLSIARDKLKSIAIHKMTGASTQHVFIILASEFRYGLWRGILLAMPIVFLFLQEWLRNFVYATPFVWTDIFIPLLFCLSIISATCMAQVQRLNRLNLAPLLK